MELAQRVFAVVDEGGFFSKAMAEFPTLTAEQALPQRMGVYPHRITHTDTGRVDVYLVCFFKGGGESELGRSVVEWCKREVETALVKIQSQAKSQ